MVLRRITDTVTRGIEDSIESVSEALFDPVIRLGVTGLSRAGKTVFITSLVSNLLHRGRMPQLRAAAEGRILSAYLQPHPDHRMPRFAYEDHLNALLGPNPSWPSSTRSISTVRVSMRVSQSGLLRGLSGPRTIHLDIVDYPGEWLLDLPLMSQSYGEWSDAAFKAARAPSRAAEAEKWLATTAEVDAGQPLNETVANSLAGTFTDYLAATRKAGLSSVAPGRFLMPGDLEGSPALTFSPLPKPEKPASGSLWRTFEKRFESYKRVVVEPFFRDHFARFDRQVVLIDTLGALSAGPQAVEDLRVAMSEILACFRPGRNSWLSQILGRRIDRILIAATKADHVHHSQHARLAATTESIVAAARDRARFSGAKTESMAIASVRATVEQTIQRNGAEVGVVRGRLSQTGEYAASYPGELPANPSNLLLPARNGDAAWDGTSYRVADFDPPVLDLKPDEAPPHIRLDRAAEYLFGDRLS